MFFTYIMLMFSCGPKGNETPQPTVESPSVQENTEHKDYNLNLDGVELQARWDDGDTFSAHTQDGENKKKIKARMNGYNTLESYGPVHSWGSWTEQELYRFAKESGKVAQASIWTCSDLHTGGGYGRLLVDCPDLRSKLLREGYAHPFSVKNAAPQKDLEDMKYARDNKKGIWEKGTPNYLITSLHSQSEYQEKNEDGSYPAFHDKGAIGGLMKGLFGYNGDPSLIELIAWVVVCGGLGYAWKETAA